MIFSLIYVFINIGPGDEVLSSVIVNQNDNQSLVLFLLTFATSILSASLGCTKCLKVGVAATIGDDGPLDGLFTGRFLIAFFGKYLFTECFVQYLSSLFQQMH